MITDNPRFVIETAQNAAAAAIDALTKTAFAAADHAAALEQSSAAELSVHRDHIAGAEARIAEMTDANGGLQEQVRDHIVANQQWSEHAAGLQFEVRSERMLTAEARDAAARIQEERGRQDAIHATALRVQVDHVAQLSKELDSVKAALLDATDRADRAEAELPIAVRTAHLAGFAESELTVPQRLTDAESAGQSVGRHAVLDLLQSSHDTFADVTGDEIHHLLTDALTNDTLAPGFPVLQLEK